MKKIFTGLLGLVALVLGGIILGTHIESEYVVKYGRAYGALKPAVLKKRQGKDQCRATNFLGIQDLNAHGSGVINYHYLKSHPLSAPGKTYVVSLMHDPIYYYQDRSLRWYGVGFTDKNLGQSRFSGKPTKDLYKVLVRAIYGTPPTDPALLKTEAQQAESLGLVHLMPLKNHADWLHNQDFMDEMIKTFESIPSDAQVYFHCEHGRGRTTTFLVIYDIFKNGNKLSLKEITDRHYCMGREDLLDTQVWKDGTWTAEALLARKDFVERFYAYRTQADGYPTQTWAQWSKKRGQGVQVVKIHR